MITFSTSLFNLPSVVMMVVSWAIIIYFFYWSFQKQVEKPIVWKAFIVMIVGVFSFSINWTIFNKAVTIPILPLGVWLLYAILSRPKEKWLKYRPFAWLGFLSSFLFLFTSILAIFIHGSFYPKDEAGTYISKVSESEIINIHPSGQEVSLDKNELDKQIANMKKENFFSDQWYEETYMNQNENKNERFPYQLIKTKPKTGSGLNTLIYVEKDGMGLLISSENEQIYFRSAEPFLTGLEEGDENE